MNTEDIVTQVNYFDEAVQPSALEKQVRHYLVEMLRLRLCGGNHPTRGDILWLKLSHLWRYESYKDETAEEIAAWRATMTARQDGGDNDWIDRAIERRKKYYAVQQRWLAIGEGDLSPLLYVD